MCFFTEQPHTLQALKWGYYLSLSYNDVIANDTCIHEMLATTKGDLKITMTILRTEND